MSERFIWETGHRRRKMHLAAYDRLGRFAGALCGIQHRFNRSCNLPLAKGVCKLCLAEERRLENGLGHDARDTADRQTQVPGGLQ